MRLRSGIHRPKALAGATRVYLALLAGLMVQGSILAAAPGEFTYQNPIEGEPGCIRDPFIIRVGDGYFITGTYKAPGKDGPAAWPGFKLWSSGGLELLK